MRAPPERLSGAQIVAAARALVPTLRERADAADRQRRVHDETFAAILDAGLLHVLKPTQYGGFELGLDSYTQIGIELGRGCASASWVYSLLAEHCWFISLFPAASQEEIWGEDGYNVSAASLAADPSRSQVERVAGGYRLSGRFPFASGSDHAQYLLLGGVAEPSRGGPPEANLFLVPKRELSMIDDWFVLGLRGTGSRSYAAESVFVPEHRAVTRNDLFSARMPGIALHPGFALLRAPRDTTASFVTSAPVVGMALGAVEAFAAIGRDLRRRTGRLVDSAPAKLALSESAAEAYAARLLIEADTAAAMRHVHDHEPLPHELQARLSRDSAFVGVLSQRAITRLHTALGTRDIFEGSPVQRALRDVNTALAQTSMQWDVRGLAYAEWALGQQAPEEFGLGMTETPPALDCSDVPS